MKAGLHPVQTRPARQWRRGEAADYPEANPLLALSERDQRSGTPACKAMPVRPAPAR